MKEFSGKQLPHEIVIMGSCFIKPCGGAHEGDRGNPLSPEKIPTVCHPDINTLFIHPIQCWGKNRFIVDSRGNREFILVLVFSN